MVKSIAKKRRLSKVKNRSQVYNPSTGAFVKRDTKTGKFIEVNTGGKPFKGIIKEKSIIKSNPIIKKKIAQKAQKAVISVRNKRANK